MPSKKTGKKRRKSTLPNESQRKKNKTYQFAPELSSVLDLLNDLPLLYVDLNVLIVEYASSLWGNTASTSLQKNFPDSPSGFLGFQQHLYLWFSRFHLVLTCDTSGKMIKETPYSRYPCRMDIDEKKSMLYIADETHVTILNFKLEFLSSWELPSNSNYFVFGLKVDGITLYLIMNERSELGRILFCNSQDGKTLGEFGNVYGPGDGEFKIPSALTVDNKYVFICDYQNHRIQTLTKENKFYFSKLGDGIPSTEQGQFNYPGCIYHHLSDDLIYIGDFRSVQLFSKDGVCIQRLDGYGTQMNQFSRVVSICVMDDRLYVGDRHKGLIQIFKAA